MDEPFSGLDELTARRLRVDLLRIWRETRKTILFVTHNAYEAAFLADRILIMAQGRIREEIAITVPRPRDYDDPAVFEANRDVVRRFLAIAGEPAPTAVASAAIAPAAEDRGIVLTHPSGERT
jgi:ABC-type nitrate/sulfonate/bicarbonate transport system ATPase subunit